MQSMTGYGSGRAVLGNGHVVVDLRAVNHRYLDVRVRLPSRIQSSTPTVERAIRGRLERGRVDAAARFEGQTLPQPALDLDRAAEVFAQLGELRDKLSPGDPLPLSILSAVPDLFSGQRNADEEALNEALTAATLEACSAVQTMRQTEGTALRVELEKLLGDVQANVVALEGALPGLIEARRQKLRDRVEALLSDVDAELQPARLEQEIAILADRADVTEELARLSSHHAQMLDLLSESEGPVGKRIEFLLQEIGREVNTIGSKVQDGKVTSLVISLKAGVEQMREQAQNVL